MSTRTDKFSVVILSGHPYSASVLYHSLAGIVPFSAVIEEDSVNRTELLKRRVKKLGIRTVFGQLVFQSAIVPALRRVASTRIQQIEQESRFNAAPIEDIPVHRVPSVNSDECRALLRKCDPDIVLVNGTRIISKETLLSGKSKFINIHAGITPRYRGVHGGYWALAQGDAENCGVTVHEVDTGIDTGRILRQTRITVTPEDNFTTYPILQLAASIPLVAEAIHMIRDGQQQYETGPSGSKLWSHPTVWQYLGNRLKTGVK